MSDYVSLNRLEATWNKGLVRIGPGGTSTTGGVAGLSSTQTEARPA